MIKKLKRLLEKLLPTVVGCLTLVLVTNANSASCFILNEPEVPKTIDKYKLFK